MALLARKKTILAKIEATYLTDPTPTGAANAILVRNLDLTPQETDFADRDLIRSYFGNSEQLPGSVRGMLSFEVEMSGAGAAGTAPAYGPLLRACAMSETISAGVSVTYAPISSAIESVTIYFNVDGVFHKFLGNRGSVVMAWSIKNVPVYRFNFTGVYVAVADAAAPTPTYTGFTKPLVVSNVNTTPFTLHSFSAVASDITLDIGNQVVHRSLIGGAESVLITDRKATGSATIEMTTVAAKNWFLITSAATIGGIDITQGITAGNKVQVTSSGVQLTNPRYADQDGVQMLQLDLRFVPTSGNDEFSIVVK